MSETSGGQFAEIGAVRERLRRPPAWGPNEQGDVMVDMTIESYERDLDRLAEAVWDECLTTVTALFGLVQAVPRTDNPYRTSSASTPEEGN